MRYTMCMQTLTFSYKYIHRFVAKFFCDKLLKLDILILARRKTLRLNHKDNLTQMQC